MSTMSMSPEPMHMGSPTSSASAYAAGRPSQGGHMQSFFTPEARARPAAANNDFMPSFLLGSTDGYGSRQQRNTSLMRTGSLRYDNRGRAEQETAAGMRSSFYRRQEGDDSGNFGLGAPRSCLRTPGSKTPGARVHWAEDKANRSGTDFADMMNRKSADEQRHATGHGWSSPPTRSYQDAINSPAQNQRNLHGAGVGFSIESSRNIDVSPSFTDQMEDSVRESVDSRWVTVFGFPPAAGAAVLSRLSQLGNVRRHAADPNGGNWMHVKLASPAEAARILAKSGMLLPGKQVKIGVEMCQDEELIQRFKAEETANNESSAMMSSSGSGGSRPPLQSMLLQNDQPQSGAKRGTDQSLSYGAASPQLVFDARNDAVDTKKRRSTARPLAMSPIRLDDSRNASPFAEPDRLNESVVSRALSYLIGN